MTSLLRSTEGFYASSPASASSSSAASTSRPPRRDHSASPLKGADDLHRDTSLKYARNSADGMSQERMKCSTCEAWVPLLDLGEHVCRPAQQARQHGSVSSSSSVGIGLDGVGEAGRGRRVNGDGPGGAGAGRPAAEGGTGHRSPRYPDRHLDPAPLNSSGPSSRGAPPARPGFVRSVSSQSTNSIASSAQSATSNGARNLPFLDKYQRLAASASQTALSDTPATGLTRSAGLADLSARTPSPNSGTTPSPNWGQYNNITPTTPIFASRSAGPGAARPNLPPSRSQDETAYSGREESGARGWQEPKWEDDRRDTIKASQSTPASLSGLLRGGEHDARVRGATAGGARPRVGRDLDGCMEDLRIMTEDDDHDGGAALLNEFFVERPQSKWVGPNDPLPPPNLPKLPPLPITAPLRPGGGMTPSPSLAALRANSTHAGQSNPRPRAVPARQPTSMTCSACHKLIDPAAATVSGDHMPFCRGCFNDRFLPKCRNCAEPITGGAVSSSDGKIVGKYHPACFSCAQCDAPFPTGEFYVWDGRPYCAVHYHKLNNSLCANPACGGPVEGACVSLVDEGGGRFHPEHFACSRAGCTIDLGEMHWVLNGLPWCERHAVTSPAPTARIPRKGSEDVSARARKRMTIVTRR